MSHRRKAVAGGTPDSCRLAVRAISGCGL